MLNKECLLCNSIRLRKHHRKNLKIQKVSEKSHLEEPVKKIKSWKEVLGITIKSDFKNETEGWAKWLKSQIYSLKTLIKEYSSIKEVIQNEF